MYSSSMITLLVVFFSSAFSCIRQYLLILLSLKMICGVARSQHPVTRKKNDKFLPRENLLCAALLGISLWRS